MQTEDDFGAQGGDPRRMVGNARIAALARLGARHTSVVMTLDAVFTVGLATLLLGEPLGRAQITGGACMLAATVVVARTRASRSQMADSATAEGRGINHPARG